MATAWSATWRPLRLERCNCEAGAHGAPARIDYNGTPAPARASPAGLAVTGPACAAPDHLRTDPVKFFVSCAKGLEYLLADELSALGAAKATATIAGVNAEGELAQALRIVMWSPGQPRAVADRRVRPPGRAGPV